MDPYIGVTGYVSSNEVRLSLECLKRADVNSRVLLMVGVLASSKTINGGTNRYAHRYPPVSRIAEIFTADPGAINLIHYATDDLGTLPTQLERMIQLGGANLHGFQINVCWPEPELLAPIKGMRVVLQLGSNALKLCAHNPANIAERLRRYRGYITDVLIDGSGGKGISMNAAELLPLTRSLVESFPDLGIGVAGGLSAVSIDLVQPLFDAGLRPSIDAEGQLRDPDDILNLHKTLGYLEAAVRLYR
ncbi:hypothetical protein IT407_01135 [Candidatus Uhrbacteria bacterium]|nr:hypothetical protein [Candidatus Uhrbacteria bacterium]